MSTSTLLYYFLDMINAIPYAYKYYLYLGGTDAEQEGKWVWTDGSPGIIFHNIFSNSVIFYGGLYQLVQHHPWINGILP